MAEPTVGKYEGLSLWDDCGLTGQKASNRDKELDDIRTVSRLRSELFGEVPAELYEERENLLAIAESNVINSIRETDIPDRSTFTEMVSDSFNNIGADIRSVATSQVPSDLLTSDPFAISVSQPAISAKELLSIEVFHSFGENGLFTSEIVKSPVQTVSDMIGSAFGTQIYVIGNENLKEAFPNLFHLQ